jgi:hypothetical protein
VRLYCFPFITGISAHETRCILILTLTFRPFGLALQAPAGANLEDIPSSYNVLVATPTGRGRFTVTSLTARSLILEMLSAVVL